MSEAPLRAAIEAALNDTVAELRPLSGGCVSRVHRAGLASGRSVVVKSGPAGSDLALEGWMLSQLAAQGWPTPAVYHESDTLLVMEHIEHDERRGERGEELAADLLASLHSVARPAFGFSRDTVIAGLAQPNLRSERWIPFFAEQRLLSMAATARSRGQLDAATGQRIERLAGRLDRWLTEPAQPALIHGDLWGGNILFHDDRVAAVIDPACYWADAEIELAFTTMFHSFDERFYARYGEQRPIAPGFFEERRELYNLYPLLVHVALFGGSYLASLRASLRRFGV